jgi:hypothetical protein
MRRTLKNHITALEISLKINKKKTISNKTKIKRLIPMNSRLRIVQKSTPMRTLKVNTIDKTCWRSKSIRALPQKENRAIVRKHNA